MVCILLLSVLFDFPSKIFQEDQGLWANGAKSLHSHWGKRKFSSEAAVSYLLSHCSYSTLASGGMSTIRMCQCVRAGCIPNQRLAML